MKCDYCKEKATQMARTSFPKDKRKAVTYRFCDKEKCYLQWKEEFKQRKELN